VKVFDYFIIALLSLSPFSLKLLSPELSDDILLQKYSMCTFTYFFISYEIGNVSIWKAQKKKKRKQSEYKEKYY